MERLREYFDIEHITEYHESRFVMFAFILLYSEDGVLKMRKRDMVDYTGFPIDKIVSCLDDLVKMGRINYETSQYWFEIKERV